MEVTSFAPGLFCWLELHTSDRVGAKAFYTGLFGWTGIENPIGPDDIYVMLQLNGKGVGGLYEDTKSGAPPHWSCYISVASADEAVVKAKSLGAAVLMEPFDVMQHGRMAALQDPTGAIFCVWESKEHHGSEVVDVPGAHCWTELMTTDKAKAEAFYTQLFGWTSNSSDARYTEFSHNGSTFAGMLAITPDMGPCPPNWAPYFQVVESDASRDKAVSLGGRALVPEMEIENVGRMAVIQDPQGAVFNIIQLK